MKGKDIRLENVEVVIRKIMNIFWGIVLLSIITEALILAFTNYNKVNFVKEFIFMPSLLLIICVGYLELKIRFDHKKDQYYSILFGSYFISITLIISHSTVKVIHSALLIPILLSLFFYSKRRVITSGIGSILLFSFIFFTVPIINGIVTISEFISTLAVLGGSTFLCVEIIKRGEEILGKYVVLRKHQKELIVENILLEKNLKLDKMTSLYNQKAFQDYLANLIPVISENNVPMQLALLDIDDFKHINDTFGHQVGDQIIQIVTSIMKENIPQNDFVARYGGEEFAVIFIDKDIRQSYGILEKMRKRISELELPEVRYNRISISIGLEEYRNGDSKDSLFKRTDQQLYEAKSAGKNRTSVNAETWGNE